MKEKIKIEGKYLILSSKYTKHFTRKKSRDAIIWRPFIDYKNTLSLVYIPKRNKMSVKQDNDSRLLVP